MGTYAMALYVLGFGAHWVSWSDASRDEVGLIQDGERLPKRV